MVSTTRIDLILQYVLLLAGQEDDFRDRDLGPIHLIKYVYLADLAFARGNHATTFTAVDWTFYKFGPWSQTVNARIPPALRALSAEERVFQSTYEDREDWTRWSKRDEHALQTLEPSLPFEIRVELRSLVHKFLKDTPALLDYVYKTGPMLHAAPGERLEFRFAVREGQRVAAEPPAELTERKRKKLRERMKEIQRAKNLKPSRNLVSPAAPRYDAAYNTGLQWLDEIGGAPLSDQNVTVEFSDEVWKSPTRNDEDLS
jgi:hypothetical protein